MLIYIFSGSFPVARYPIYVLVKQSLYNDTKHFGIPCTDVAVKRLTNDSVAAVLLAMIPSSDQLKTLVFFLNIRYSDAEVSAQKLG